MTEPDLELYSSAVPVQILKSRDIAINERWSELHGMTKSFAEASINFLFVTNSGGVAVLIGFMGVSESVRQSLGPKLSLSCFVLGLITVGILKAYILHRLYRCYHSWRDDVSSYYEQKLRYNELRTRDNKRTEKDKTEFRIGYLSGALLVVGGALGISSFFCSYLMK